MDVGRSEYPKHAGPDFEFFGEELKFSEIEKSWWAVLCRKLCASTSVAATAIVSGAIAYVCRGLSGAARELSHGTLIVTTVLSAMILAIGLTAMILDRRQNAENFKDQANFEIEPGCD